MKSSIWSLLVAAALVCAVTLGVVTLGVMTTPAMAADQAAPYTPVPPPEEGMVQFTYSWRDLPPLPRRFQNHCGFFRGHYVCADHCGPTYQLYFCSPVSFGCCHVGQGYCGGDAGLRCGTWPFVFPFPLN
jgi:hypothetical protein